MRTVARPRLTLKKIRVSEVRLRLPRPSAPTPLVVPLNRPTDRSSLERRNGPPHRAPRRASYRLALSHHTTQLPRMSPVSPSPWPPLAIPRRPSPCHQIVLRLPPSTTRYRSLLFTLPSRPARISLSFPPPIPSRANATATGDVLWSVFL
jgi:hypothetical protein